MTRCFCYNGAPVDLNRLSLIPEKQDEAYNEYDFRLQIQNKVLSPQKARVAYRLRNILSIDDILYIDAVVNEVAIDFLIIRPNKGILIINLFEKDLGHCKLSNDNKEIETEDCKYQNPIDRTKLCQTSIKDGIEELLIGTIENNRNFSLIKKLSSFLRILSNKLKNSLNLTYLFQITPIYLEKNLLMTEPCHYISITQSDFSLITFF